MKNLIIIASFAFVCGCLPKPDKMIPFPFSFPAESDGCSCIYVRKLSIRQTDAIHVQVNLLAGNNLRPFLAGTSGPLVFNLSPTQTIVSCWIDEFSGKPADFRWEHFDVSENPQDRWEAKSGKVIVNKCPRSKDEYGDGFFTSVQISNVVFHSSNTQRRTKLDSLSFTNVHVGWSPR